MNEPTEMTLFGRCGCNARIAELEASDLSNPKTRSAAFAKVAELKRLLEELDKTIRWSVPQWKVDLDQGVLDSQT